MPIYANIDTDQLKTKLEQKASEYETQINQISNLLDKTRLSFNEVQRKIDAIDQLELALEPETPPAP